MDEPAGVKDLADELRTAETKFRHMAENVPGALFRYVRYPDGREAVHYLSTRCVDLWEVPAELIQHDGSLLWSMIDAEDLPAMQSAVMQSAQTMAPWRLEWRITTPALVPDAWPGR